MGLATLCEGDLLGRVPIQTIKMGVDMLHLYDIPRGLTPHMDALVIAMDITGMVVHCVLVDTGNNVNVLYLDSYNKLEPKDSASLESFHLGPLQ